MAEKREKLSKFDRQRLELQKLQERIRADTERAKQLEISSRQTGQNDLWNKAKKTGLTIDQVFDYIDKLAALVSHRMTRPEFDDFLLELLGPYLDKKLDSVVLGCTHYPFARKMIQSIVGDTVTIFDGGAGTAREMRRRIAAADLLNPSEEHGWVKFENSVATEEELALCRRLLEWEI